MKRTMTAAVAALAVSGLAACGSSGSTAVSTPSGHPTNTHATTGAAHAAGAAPTPSASSTTSAPRTPPAPTPTAKPTTVSDSFKWKHSLCSKIDVNDVAAVLKAIPDKQNELVHSEMGYLTTDNCQFDLITSNEYGNAANFGLSARTWTVAEWKQLVKNSLRGADSLKSVKLGAHGAMIDGSIASGWVLVGDRILTVLGPFKATTAAQVKALLKLAMPKVKSVKPLPTLLGIPECGEANTEAAAVIGGPATVRRDEMLEGNGRKSPLCGWATRGGSVSLFGQYTGSPATDQIDRRLKQVKDAQRVKGVGVAAVYFPSGAELDVTTKESLVTIRSSGTHTNKKRLVALARALLSNY